MKKLDIAVLPELKTSVGMHGSSKQKEVGGPLCAGGAIGLIIINYAMHRG
jgi:hypothetical protein